MTRLQLAFAALLLASPALSQEPASGDAIRAAIAGNSVMGSMIDSGAYSEFYAADGTIRGSGYTGSWTVEGDTMCFDYGDDPATCWNVALNGEAVSWIVDGKEVGTGTLVAGNPNNY